MVISSSTMTNSDFLAELYGPLEDGRYGWVTNFRSDPGNSAPEVWSGRIYKGTPAQATLIDRVLDDNTYFCTAVLRPSPDGEMVRRKECFERLAVLVVDDVQLSDVTTYSYAIQTSPGKHQVGIFLDEDDADCRDIELVNRVMQSLSVVGRANDRSGNACVRYVRLPNGSNTKQRAAGPWPVRMEFWNPRVRWTLEDAAAAVGVDLDQLKKAQHSPTVGTPSRDWGAGFHLGEMVTNLTGPISERCYHDNIVKIAASLIAGGMFPGAAVNFLYSLMDEAKPSGPYEEVKRWESRRAEIPRAVDSAKKFTPPERLTAVSVNIGVAKGQNEDSSPPELLLDLATLNARTGKISWQVKHMIPDDSLGMIFGASGTFKSFIALDHALHVAHGMPWMGKKTKKGPVVYVAAEGGAGIARRVQAWHIHHGLEIPQDFHVCITPLVLSEPTQVVLLASEIDKLAKRPSLIYIDTLSQTFDGDENSSNDIASYLRLINSQIRAKFHATVIVIHHSGHMATERPRGSSALTANVDFMLGVYRPDADRMAARVDVVKQKDGDRLSGQTFEMEKHHIDKDEDGDDISSLVAVWGDMVGKVLDNHAAKLTNHENAILKALEQANGQMADTDLRHIFYNQMGDEAKRQGKQYVQDTARKAFVRAYQSLSARGAVKMDALGVVKIRLIEPENDQFA